ncbi:hypothetical protein HYPSUDRAFT_49830 [Hypholoma sublateritium FD-334 SS-4]|uniref:F-box domain-containing protein n=1 Tax=Hypholoma sublateritium (strain FD-334 SS-4) TaxID=945553 RepID=A0A0D2NY75_HYPSF|nr:hypothetical protein HYPSUDRAFT_49830 [Hypholoma sublateritium FD-334 SS-4]
MVCFLNLPPEIINCILHDLSPPDVVACQLSNKFLDTTVRESVMLQYKLALTRAFAKDSPLSHSLTADRLDALKNIENSWISMKPDFSLTVPVSLRQSGVYDLTAGVYLLSDLARTSLGFLRLPEKESDVPQWAMHKVGKLIIDVGLCVYEHDLMAIVTSTVRIGNDGAPNTFDIGLDLVELSTRKPHPLAKSNPIFVMNSAWEKPAVGIEIVGKHLALVLSFNARGHPQDRIYIFEWQTGVCVASFESRSHTYAGLIFLDEINIVLPNTRNNTLDIYQIPPAPTVEPLRPILVLSLPPLIEGRILGFATCRAEPNPVSKESYPAMRARAATSGRNASRSHTDIVPNRGFLLKSSTALCMFELRVHVLEFNIVPGGGLQMGFPFRYSFTFVVQRQALLDLVFAHARKSTDPPASSATPLNPALPPMLPYAEWGPSRTAWFGSNENDVSPHWITTSAGRRCVRMAASTAATPEGERFFICEFGGDIVPPKSTDGDSDPLGKGKGKAEEPDASNASKPHKSKRPTARSIEEADRRADLEWSRARRASRAANPSNSDANTSTHAGPSTATPEIVHAADDTKEAAEGETIGDDNWPHGAHPAISYTSWVLEQAHGVGEDAIDPYAFEDLQDESDLETDDENEGINDLHDHIHAHGSENGDNGVPFHPVFATTDDGDDEQSDNGFVEELQNLHNHHFDHDSDYGDQSVDDHDENWAIDPLPDSEEDTLVVSGERVLDCPEVFREPIHHNLPYIVRGSRDRYRWDGVLLDEERVIGIHATDASHVEKIEIVHFG